MELNPTTYWEHLVWMDASNHGGVRETKAMAQVLESDPRAPMDDGEDEEDTIVAAGAWGPTRLSPASCLILRD